MMLRLRNQVVGELLVQRLAQLLGYQPLQALVDIGIVAITRRFSECHFLRDSIDFVGRLSTTSRMKL